MSEAIVRAQFKSATTEKPTPTPRPTRHVQVPLPGFTTVTPPKPFHVMPAVRA
jgi:hypothetical protein